MAKVQARRSILITGCSPGGIGHSLAKEFHSRGLHVIASARSRDVIADLEDIGIDTLSLDVTSQESIEEARRNVVRLTGEGGLWGLVNNAGQNCTLPALDVPINDARACFETNFFGVVALTQVFTPLMIESKKGGLIINIGSVTAVIPYVFGSVYNASKAALHAYSRTLRLELEPFDIKVMVVVTGGVQSNIARRKRVLPPGSLYTDIVTDFERRTNHSQEGAMDNKDYARGVVNEALKKSPKKWVWRGHKSFLIWLASRWVGSWIFDMIFPRMFGLDRLKAIVSGRDKKAR